MLAFFPLVFYFECNFVDIVVIGVVDVKREKNQQLNTQFVHMFSKLERNRKISPIAKCSVFSIALCFIHFSTSTKQRLYTDENWKQIVELKKNKSNVNIYAKV